MHWASFTAQMDIGAGLVTLDIDAPIPSVSEVRVIVRTLGAVDADWTWKVQDGAVVYQPVYGGHFHPQMLPY